MEYPSHPGSWENNILVAVRKVDEQHICQKSLIPYHAKLHRKSRRGWWYEIKLKKQTALLRVKVEAKRILRENAVVYKNIKSGLVAISDNFYEQIYQ